MEPSQSGSCKVSFPPHWLHSACKITTWQQWQTTSTPMIELGSRTKLRGRSYWANIRENKCEVRNQISKWKSIIFPFTCHWFFHYLTVCLLDDRLSSLLLSHLRHYCLTFHQSLVHVHVSVTFLSTSRSVSGAMYQATRWRKLSTCHSYIFSIITMTMSLKMSITD